MKRKEYYEEQKLKKLVYVFTITLILSIVGFLTVFVMYNKKLKAETSESLLNLSKMNAIVDNDNLREVSYSSDSSVATNKNNVNNIVNENTTTVKKISKAPIESKVEVQNVVQNEESNEPKEEVKKELSFMAPVKGEIIKDFAIDTLVYSKTLEEWTTHSGIDIKADKTSVVSAAEEGVVESIKNDPRYGLTVIISHRDGFKTMYSNLLTTEFVSEGDNVEKGQTIATIGDSASFEISDDFHLHFEMYRDNNLVNPTIYLK